MGIIRIRALAALLLLAPAACSGGGSSGGNWALGQWKIVDPSCSPMTAIELTDTTYAGFETPQGSFPGWHRMAASYTVSKEEIFLHAGGGDYRIEPIDADHIKPDDLAACVYERVK